MKVQDLKPAPFNPRQISDKQLEMLSKSMQEFGDLSGIIVNVNTSHIIGGHQRVKVFDPLWPIKKQAYKDEQGTSAIGHIKTPYGQWIYREVNWDREKEAVANIAANKQGGEWDFPKLTSILSELDTGNLDMELTGFDVEELENIFTSYGQSEDELDEGPEPQIDRMEELQKEWGVELGQIWQIGDHGLLCGDSTKPEDVKKLMGEEKANIVFTDPPYGMNLDADYSKMPQTTVHGKKYNNVIGDNSGFDFKMFGHIECPEQFWWGADYYCQQLPSGGSWFVWDKRNENNDTALGSGFELCWSKSPHKRKVLRYLWSGFTARDPGEQRTHPTQKPIALCQELMSDYSNISDIIFDPFLGSGTTMVACQNLNRKCRGIEISPAYVAVTLQRMTDMGLKPKLVKQ